MELAFETNLPVSTIQSDWSLDDIAAWLAWRGYEQSESLGKCPVCQVSDDLFKQPGSDRYLPVQEHPLVAETFHCRACEAVHNAREDVESKQRSFIHSRVVPRADPDAG